MTDGTTKGPRQLLRHVVIRQCLRTGQGVNLPLAIRSNQRVHRHGGEVAHIHMADSRLTARAIERSFGSDRLGHEGHGVLHEAVGSKEGPRHTARLYRFLDRAMDASEAVRFFGGAHHRLFDYAPHARRLCGFDGVHLEFGLIQGIRPEEKHCVASAKRLLKRLGFVVVDDDRFNPCRARTLGPLLRKVRGAKR